MTYCVATLAESGLAFASDCRTNAGVDNVATFGKMSVYEQRGERLLVLMTSGNLAITQAVISEIRAQIVKDAPSSHLLNAESLFDAARLVGKAVRRVYEIDAQALARTGTEFSASFILGGQIKGEHPRLFLIYKEGNFIEATPDTCFFQIGENKYGKPILDRVITWKTSLFDAAKCMLISFDSTIRSNISVGLPIDLLIYERDKLFPTVQRRLWQDDPYFSRIGEMWSEGLRRVFGEIPAPEWLRPEASS